MTSTNALSYTYYPGCSLEGLSKEYHTSLCEVCRALDMNIEELEDWNCCGASTLVAVDELFSVLAPARNLALASELDRDLLVACNSCYVVLRRTLEQYRTKPDLKEKIDEALGLIGRKVNPELPIRHIVEVIHQDVGTEAVAAQVAKPLKGLRIAPYYGCQAARPYNLTASRPLETLLETVGAEVVPFDSKTRCCGSSLLASLKMEGLELAHDILREATDQKVDALAVVCPLCQVNVDAFQGQVNARYGTQFRIPVLYFTQLMGLAFGLPQNKLGINRLVTPATSLLKKLAGQKEVAVT